ncbi:MarR family winged helix-turn-helix transcriptional regulator [Nocardiopsis halotolerans]|uniref:MarR family winged helix-turn-helix transcriptional regulator n=1 Tax=Nocardiopsis halotolerans TaxID=124252 RepID=UPI0003458210|nr:MarR family transcriptional regulator [Nocardiopsis halotolerans]
MDEADLERAVRANHELFMTTSDRTSAPLAALDLTHATASALWAIDPDAEPPSMRTLARRLYCNAPNLTFVVDQLASRGLVERRVDPADRRSRVVALTERGRRVRAEAVRVACEATPLSALDPAELREVVRLLESARRRHEARP